MVLNDATHKLFRPDRELPTRDDFEAAAKTLNALPVALTESIDITNAILYLVSESGRYVTGTTHVSMPVERSDTAIRRRSQSNPARNSQ
ncbi:hypothetical protein M2275_006241 [Rhodococcus opacus]|nr:hypothetical protein [Rhodococcus opacus]